MKIIFKRRAKPQASQTEVFNDVLIGGEGGHEENEMAYNPPSPDLDFFGGSSILPQTDEVMAEDLTGVETGATIETGEGVVVEPGLSTMVASPGAPITGSTHFRWKYQALNDSKSGPPLIIYMLLALLEKLQEASADAEIIEPIVGTGDILMEGLSDEEAFHNAALAESDAPLSDPV
ncbi:uncharacterized protein LOC109826912 [Asparagus officinalis]|uniref:uncharacterized protein LOC109826912 n=1 Tax=Asparagus officinalis TaxID=4686 RepID=UPI00098DF738|nr:uncharacterized protein LOC109826912 [Asparagus officinalis]